jgi:thiamine biosynthesis lipoprotein
MARWLLTLCLGLSLIGCKPSASPEPVRWRHMALGTWVDMTVYGAPDAASAREQLDALLDQAHQDWHAWHPSVLTNLNHRLQSGECVRTDAQMTALVTMAQAMYDASRGLFDPSIGPLLNLWGFQKDAWDTAWQPPSAAAIEAWRRSRGSMADLFWKDGQLCSRSDHLSLDFGGFGKGFALQLVSEKMHELGWHNHMINGGGDIVVSGLAGERPWRIAVRDPLQPDSALAVLEVQGPLSIFTSGTYERKHEFAGKTYHHILDPRTGFPAQGVLSATVLGRDPAWADAAATALLVAGPDCAAALARRMKAEAWLLIDESGKAYLSPSMRDRIHWLKKVPVQWQQQESPEVQTCKL